MLVTLNASEVNRLLDIEQRHYAMCHRLAECARRHGVIQDGGLYADQVIIAALDDAAGLS